MPINLLIRIVVQLIQQLGPEWLKNLPWDQIMDLVTRLIGRIQQIEAQQASGQEVQAIDWEELISLVIRIIQLIMDSRPGQGVATIAYPQPDNEALYLLDTLKQVRADNDC